MKLTETEIAMQCKSSELSHVQEELETVRNQQKDLNSVIDLFRELGVHFADFLFAMEQQLKHLKRFRPFQIRSTCSSSDVLMFQNRCIRISSLAPPGVILIDTFDTFNVLFFFFVALPPFLSSQALTVSAREPPNPPSGRASWHQLGNGNKGKS